MLAFATCKKCCSQFIPNCSTIKCTYCKKYRCAACVLEFGGSTQNAKAYCGCNSTNWVKLSHLTQSNLNADEQLWAQSTEPEWSFSEAHLKTEIQQLKKGIKNLSKENKELKDQMERVAKENKSTVWHGESRRKDREELRDEIKTLQKEVASIKSQFINFENPKEDGSGDGVLVEQIGQLHQENAELKAKFDEFEEYSEMIKNIQLDQERVEQNNREIEERSAEGSSSLEVKIEELHGKIDNFVAETKSNLNCKKNQLILKMKADIHKLQEKQKVLIDQSRNLQQQNIKRSKVLQNKLELTECKFNETVQIKTSLISYYYDTEGDSKLPSKDSESLEKNGQFGSALSLSTTASSFERIPDQQL